jgi:hypothetical protein
MSKITKKSTAKKKAPKKSVRAKPAKSTRK